MNNPHILVVGSINADMILSLSAMPGEGESVLAKAMRLENGGKGANQAVAAARLGAGVTFCAMVGNDENGLRLRKSIEGENIHTQFLFSHSGLPTGTAMILLEEDGSNRIIVYPGANMELKEKTILPAFANQYDALLVQLEMPDETVLAACRMAAEKNMKIILDAGPARPFALEALPCIDILSPNRSEAEAFTGIAIESFEDGAEACRLLQERSGAQHIVLKMDKEGAMLYNARTCKHFPPVPVKAVDTTAAGDAFTAALTKWYTQTNDIEAAILAANAAGSVAVQTMGAQPSLPTLAQVERLLDFQ